MSARIKFNSRNVNKIMTLSFMFLLLLSLAGCGTKKSIEEKAGEALVEEIMEDAGAEVDVDGETVTIKGEDGEEMVFGETEWPTSDLAKNVPEFETGKVIAVVEANDSVMISLEEVAKEDFMDYLDIIKKDYTVDPMEANSEGNVTYLGGNSSGISVQLYYVDETLSIMVIKIPE
jgi:hypothetical protein